MGAADRFAVAGLPFVHVASGNLQPPLCIVPDWVGSRVDAAPVRVVHTLGPASDSGLRLIVDGPLPQGAYYLDAAGNVAVRLPVGALPGMRAQLLRTTHPGFEYELISEQEDDVSRLSREWHRTLLMLAMPARAAGLVIHAAGLVVGGRLGLLCPGVSGAGKSTLAGMMAAAGSIGLSDDRVVLSGSRSALRLWGTPWHSSAKVASPADIECHAIVFPRRGSGLAFTPVAAGAAARRIFRTAAFPFWDARGTEFALSLIDQLVTTVRAFEFTYVPSSDAAAYLSRRLLREFLLEIQ